MHRRVARARRAARLVRTFALAMHSAARPVLANVVVARRCNLACAYCNQYDNVSDPVPEDLLRRRIGELERLGVLGITFTGGEPLLHPGIAALVRRARKAGAIVTVNTNGLLLTPAIIDSFNRAGLDYLWMSIDNLAPDETSAKSLRTLDRKLQWLAREARFGVTVNSVLGAGIRSPEDALAIARRARELGHHSTVGILHREGGHLIPLPDDHRAVFEKIQELNKRSGVFGFAQYDSFQGNLARGFPNHWHCVAGGRFLYVCEDGLVHYCSQRRGKPGVPLEQYTPAWVLRESAAPKACAPFCTINCVQQVSYLESFRLDPEGAVQSLIGRRKALDPSFKTPLAVTVLRKLFAGGKTSNVWRKLATYSLGLRR